MTHFVRCIDGHVFDAEVALQCPVCGAIVDAPPQVAAIASAAVTPGVSDSDATQTKPPAPPARRELPAQLRRSALRIVIGGVILAPILAVFKLFVLPSIYPPAGAASVGAIAAADLRRRAGHARANQRRSLEANAATAAAPVAPVDISDTIKSALKVARMAVLYDRHEYSQVADIARNLNAQDNVAGPFMLGTLQLGPLGTQNIPEARKQFTGAAKLGDSDAAMLAARMMEQGAGGPRDVDGAKALYLFAARNGDTNADRELARLNISDQRGMTVIEADNNLFAGKDIDESWKRMNEANRRP